jgi:BirA family biotin operon repressor/biotin-[acetyl-CoA-carboxylase] ligase
VNNYFDLGGVRLFCFENVASTNDEVVKLLGNGVEPMFCVIANKQTNGRGRCGSLWISQNPGNIYFSAALPVEIFVSRPMGVFAQVFVLKFIVKFGGMLHLSIKWPNDIFLAGKKVGGVLLETCFADKVLKRAVFGVGINVLTAPDLSNVSGIAYEATALKTRLQSVTYQFVLDAVIGAIEEAVNLYKYGKYTRFIANNWNFFDMLYGKWVNVSCGEKIFSGNESGVDANGNLVLRLDNGVLLRFDSASAKVVL